MTPATVPGSEASTKKLTILFVGCLGRSARSAMVMRALRDLGHDVRAVNSETLNEHGERHYFNDFVWKLRSKIGVPPDRVNVNRSLLHTLAQRRVDVLWIAKALSLRPETLIQARRMQPHISIAFHSEDDMFARHNQSLWFRRALPLYDVVFTHKSYNAHPGELPSLGARRVVMVDKCFHRNLHRPVEVTSTDRGVLGGGVGFVGTFESERAETMLALARAGIPVRVWGSHWEAWRNRHPNLRVEGRALDGEEYVRAIASTDVNLGFLRKQNRDLQTGRSVEIPACGGFMLAERTDEHLSLFFEEGDRGRVLRRASRSAWSKDEVLDVENAAERRAASLRPGHERCLSGRLQLPRSGLTGMLRVARWRSEK